MEQPEIIEQGLLDVKTHNLMMRLIEERRSLSRIKTNQIKHSNNDEEYRNFLKKLKKNKEEHIKELEERLGKTPVLNLEMKPQKNLRALLTNQGSTEKGTAELSKGYNLPTK
ncbi:MAG: hypothetical protein QCH99_08545 [Candidatus Bathyarchaeota archaeon]|nr:hypothetical protein [Candidatus Bathyarchaeum tardum]WGM89922.1 MAG: hypothetical protein NUK63_02035 [Candidatus Bathyarchaeum tardum]